MNNMKVLYCLCFLVTLVTIVDSSGPKRCPRINDFPGKVKYRRRGTKAQFRCPRGTTRYGNKFVMCQSDDTWSGEPPVCIVAGCVPIDLSNADNLDMSEKFNGALLTFTCEGGYHLIGTSEIYCDGRSWSGSLPKCIATEDLTECDFEKDDLCGWTQDKTDDRDWIRNAGTTQTGNTGPKHDHTFPETTTGNYMYFETSNPTSNNDQARLLSPLYTEDLSPMCFDFWYHILGPGSPGHVGSLQVFVLVQSEFIDDIQPMFYKEGNQGDVWNRGEIVIDKMDEPYQIVIVATRKLSYISDIAIDDVRLYNCSSPTTTVTSTTVKPKTSTAAPTTTTRITTKPTTATATATSKPNVSSIASGTSSAITSTPSMTTQSPAATVISIQTKPTQTITTYPPTKKLPKSSKVSDTKEQTTSLSEFTNSTYLLQSSMTSGTTKVSTMSSTQATTKTSKLPSTPKATTLAIPSRPTTKTAGKQFKTSTKKMTPTAKLHTPVSISTIIIPMTSRVKPTIIDDQTTVTTTKSTTETPTLQTPVFTSRMSITASTANPTTTNPTTTSKPTKSLTTKHSKPSKTTSVTKAVISTVKTPKILTEFPTVKSNTTDALSTTPENMKTTTLTIDSSMWSTTDIREPMSSTTNKVYHSTLTTTIYMKASSAVATPKPSTDIKAHQTAETSTSKNLVKTNTIKTSSENSTGNTTLDPSVVVAEQRTEHPDDETLKPLMIGLGVGIIVGLIIIGVVAYVCVRRRKFYTSRYEDELKPITKSTSSHSLNNVQYYHDDDYESES